MAKKEIADRAINALIQTGEVTAGYGASAYASNKLVPMAIDKLMPDSPNKDKFKKIRGPLMTAVGVAMQILPSEKEDKKNKLGKHIREVGKGIATQGMMQSVADFGPDTLKAELGLSGIDEIEGTQLAPDWVKIAAEAKEVEAEKTETDVSGMGANDAENGIYS